MIKNFCGDKMHAFEIRIDKLSTFKPGIRPFKT